MAYGCRSDEVLTPGGACACPEGEVRQGSAPDAPCVPWLGEAGGLDQPPAARPPYGPPYTPGTERLPVMPGKPPPTTGGGPDPQGGSGNGAPGPTTGPGGPTTPGPTTDGRTDGEENGGEMPTTTMTPGQEPWTPFCNNKNQFWSPEAMACIPACNAKGGFSLETQDNMSLCVRQNPDGQSAVPPVEPEDVADCLRQGGVWDTQKRACVPFYERGTLQKAGIPDDVLDHCVVRQFGDVPYLDCRGVMFMRPDSGEPTDQQQWMNYVAMQDELQPFGEGDGGKVTERTYGFGTVALVGLGSLVAGFVVGKIL